MPFIGSTWQIGLSALLPLLVCLVLFVVEARGPLSLGIQRTKGIVAPYFASVSILFGLFAALLADDVWRKTNEAKRAVQVEADTVELLADLARANGLAETLLPRLRAYIEAASAEHALSASIGEQRAATSRAYLDFLTTLSQRRPADLSAANSMQTAARELMRAHEHRLYLADDVTAPVKWFAILVFGTITQVAIMLVHVGNRRAMRVSVGLFTVAFSICLIIVAIFDAPFDILLVDEPARTLGRVLPRL